MIQLIGDENNGSIHFDESGNKKKWVTIQPYKLWLLITKVHFVAFYETFKANVFRYRFHEHKDIP